MNSIHVTDIFTENNGTVILKIAIITSNIAKANEIIKTIKSFNSFDNTTNINNIKKEKTCSKILKQMDLFND